MIHTPENIAAFGEIFTPTKIVNEMLDLLDPKVWSDPATVFVETSCGDGAFFLPIIERRYEALGGGRENREADHQALSVAINSIWGAEVQPTHVRACRAKIRNFVATFTDDEEFLQYTAWILRRRIFCMNGLDWPNIPENQPESLRRQVARIFGS